MMALDARILLGSQNYIEPYGNALARAMQLKAQQQGMQMNALQMQQAQQQMAEKERQRNALQELIGSIPSPQMAASQNALAGGGGPTVQNAQRMAPADPRLQMLHGAMKAGAVSPVDYIGAAYPQAKPADYKVVGDALVKIGPTGVEPVYKGEKKPEAAPSSIREYEYAKAQGYKGTFEQWDRDSKKAGASKVEVNTGKEVPASVVKYQDEIIDRLTTARSIDADLGGIEQRIKAGALKFGPVSNITNQARNAVGLSTEESRNFATFKSTLEKLRNDSLRLNTGVQTEGDAQRAWNELFQNINDQALVEQRLGEIRKINQRAAQLQQYRLGVLRENFKAGELPAAPVTPAITPAPTVKPSVSNW